MCDGLTLQALHNAYGYGCGDLDDIVTRFISTSGHCCIFSLVHAVTIQRRDHLEHDDDLDCLHDGRFTVLILAPYSITPRSYLAANFRGRIRGDNFTAARERIAKSVPPFLGRTKTRQLQGGLQEAGEAVEGEEEGEEMGGCVKATRKCAICERRARRYEQYVGSRVAAESFAKCIG